MDMKKKMDSKGKLKLAGKGVNFDPKFTVKDDDFIESSYMLLQLKDYASPSDVKKKKIDRIESQPKSKSISESPFSSHRMTRSQIQRLLGACKDEEKDISKGNKKVYKRKSMYRCGGFPLAFQCWFYECCPYANDKLVVRVGDSVSRVLNWSVMVRPNYRKVKFAFSDIHREQEHAVFKKSDGSSDSSKEHMREDSPVNSQNELKLLRTDLNLLKDEVLSMKQLMTSLFDLIFKALHINEGSKYHSGHNVGLKNDDTHAGNPIGVNLSDNVERQTDSTPKVDHVSDNLVDGVGQKIIGVGDCIDVDAGNKLSANLFDDVEKENVEVGDHIDVVARDHLSDNVVDDIGKETVDVGNRIDRDAGDRPITGDEWSAFPNFDFFKFTPSSNKIGEDVKNSFEDSWSDFSDYEVSKFTQLISQENVQYMKDLVENSQEIDWSVVPDSEISKYTQPDKIGEYFVIEKAVGKIDTDLGFTSVVLVAIEVLVDVGSVRKNIDDTSVGDKSTVILDDTPVVPRRIRKPTAICESPYVSKFDSDCSKVQGKPSKCIDKGPSRKYIFNIKQPFTISITEPFLDMKLLSSFTKFVDKSLRLNSNPIYSKSVNNLANFFDFGVVTIKIKEWFYTLGYAGVHLTDSKSKYTLLDGGSSFTTTDCWFNCLIQSLYSKFLGKRKDVVVSKEDSEIFEYILDYVMRRNVPWYSIDNVLFPINIFENFHWILARLSFKEQCIYVYDSMRGARYRRVAEKAVSTYSELIPNLLSSIDFWDKRSDGIAAADSFDIRMVDGLPTQKNTLNFKYSTLDKATGSFDEANKLEQGGFGTVYKGVLADGREVTVKRLF
ncbi:Cysteine-rich receptor-like protein kinase 2 [Capsicum baccatum]|uniref:Cysteine-rich receptor-like protein kinase 2 n=1 Tax=Capsicum baccatum TaxID=33114 RepID=A0A2G2WTQ6_CAPBA|nr:Cysteine-rich receptor-like protein kinase 2 [Capsicum baccatum]